ncbi:hypothetical protein GCM10020358_74130 [Amorphoplanes nipponensis]|uniref:Uncharacterized protein n=1 Tax=Actinoplanes nipponensis TaxID=135950 RepID=A0A919MK54_9ACTN|nr:hypothetical protein [Actinoplanes nipponensis]GIE48141.1 hypothetical protein Ani05nite_16750 [Actinoplanes nipponensis]
MSLIVRSAAVALAGAVASLVGWLVVGGYDVDAARQERLSQRSPVMVSGAAPAIARYGESGDVLDGRQFSVVGLVPLAGGSPPPGLSRWPEPGEAWLSPALLAADRTGDLRSRYGRFAGAIGPAGLADLNEFFVYYRPVGPPVAAAESWRPVSAWGRSHPFAWVSSARNRSPEVFAGFVVGLAGPPAVLLARVAGRTRRRRPRERTPAGLARWLIETLVAAAVGAATAGALARWALETGVTLPITGFRLTAGDVGGGLERFVALVAGAAVGVAVAASIPDLTAHRRPAGRTLRAGGPSAESAWPRRLAAGAVIVAILAATGLPLDGWVLGGAGLVLLVTAPFVARRGAVAFGRRLGASAGGHEHRAAAARWLRTGSAPVARFAALLGLVLVGSTVVLCTVTRTGAEEARALHLRATVGARIVQITSGELAAGRARLVERFGAGRVLGVTTRDGGVVVTGACAALAQLGSGATCPSAPTPINRITIRPSEFGRALLTLGIVRARSAGAPGPDGLRALLVLNPDGASGYRAIARSAYALVALPEVSLPGQEWLGAVRESHDDAGWVRLLAMIGIVIVVVAGALDAAVSCTRHRRSFDAAAGSRRATLAVAAWAMLPALMIACGIVTAVAYGAALALRGQYGSGEIPATLLTSALPLTIVAAAAGSLLCAAMSRPA